MDWFGGARRGSVPPPLQRASGTRAPQQGHPSFPAGTRGQLWMSQRIRWVLEQQRQPRNLLLPPPLPFAFLRNLINRISVFLSASPLLSSFSFAPLCCPFPHPLPLLFLPPSHPVWFGFCVLLLLPPSLRFPAGASVTQTCMRC